MKRNIISYISVAAVCCTASVACSDFLTEELQTDYSSKTFYTSAANAERAVNGIYNNIMFTSDQNMLWVFGDVASDDSEKGGSAGDKSDIDYINNFSAMADNGILGDYWTYLYEGVARAQQCHCLHSRYPDGRGAEEPPHRRGQVPPGAELFPYREHLGRSAVADGTQCRR